jgi:hypothetical protein
VYLKQFSPERVPQKEALFFPKYLEKAMNYWPATGFCRGGLALTARLCSEISPYQAVTVSPVLSVSVATAIAVIAGGSSPKAARKSW